jgi:hypothetical protein
MRNIWAQSIFYYSNYKSKFSIKVEKENKQKHDKHQTE